MIKFKLDNHDYQFFDMGEVKDYCLHFVSRFLPKSDIGRRAKNEMISILLAEYDVNEAKNMLRYIEKKPCKWYHIIKVYLNAIIIGG